MVLRRQAFQFDLRPNGQQLRNLRQFAGSCRLVYNQALALNLERYEKKEKRLGYAGLCALLANWKMEHEFLSAVPAQALQQSLKNDISKNHAVVCIEDLQVKNMSKRAAKKVAQKSGLNRSILDASRFELRANWNTKHSGKAVCWFLCHRKTRAASALSVGTYRQRIASRKQSSFASSVRSQPMRILLLR
jgi:transposase